MKERQEIFTISSVHIDNTNQKLRHRDPSQGCGKRYASLPFLSLSHPGSTQRFYICLHRHILCVHIWMYFNVWQKSSSRLASMGHPFNMYLSFFLRTFFGTRPQDAKKAKEIYVLYAYFIYAHIFILLCGNTFIYFNMQQYIS